MLNEKEIKILIFEIYSAGYIDGYNNQNLKTSFEKYYNYLKELVENEENKNY